MGDAMRRRAGDVLAVEENAPCARRKLASEQIEERRLPRAIWADDRVQRPRLDCEGHAVHGGERAEGLAQLVCREDRHAPNLLVRRAHASTTPPRKKSTTMTNATPRRSGQRSHITLTDSESQMKTNEPMIGP